MEERLYKLRGLVEGEAEAELLVLTRPLSLYGELDPETGRIHGNGSAAGKILAMPGTRGSTVGSYILYAAARNGVAPQGIVVAKAEPILVAAAVMAETPLAEGLPPSVLEELAEKNCWARLSVQPPYALLRLRCSHDASEPVS